MLLMTRLVIQFMLQKGWINDNSNNCYYYNTFICQQEKLIEDFSLSIIASLKDFDGWSIIYIIDDRHNTTRNKLTYDNCEVVWYGVLTTLVKKSKWLLYPFVFEDLELDFESLQALF